MTLSASPCLDIGRRLWIALAVFGMLGCTTPPVSEVCPSLASTAKSRGGFARRPKLDILFVIGNSGSMATKQHALAGTFGDLLAGLDHQGYEWDYHIGIATTDVGSWVAPRQPWTISAGACDSFAGDDGQLQAVSCLDRQNGSAVAAQTCSAVCPDRRFVPTDGSPFVSGYRGFHNVPVAMELDPKTGVMVDRGPEYALSCLALVGDGGCPLSSPMEAMKRALDGHLPANQGFLRDDASLLVVIVTDTDDCSVQAARRAELDPHTRNCSSPDFNAAPECFALPFRCLASNIQCDQPLNTAGTKTNCQKRLDSYLEPVQNYLNFLQTLRPQGRAAIVGLWALPAVDAGGQVVVIQDPKVAGSAGLSAAVGAQAACQSASDPNFVGQPQLRLSHLAAQFRDLSAEPVEGNICDPQDYLNTETALLWDPLLCYLKLVGLGGIPRLLENGTPNCRVGDVEQGSPDAVPETAMPPCGPGCCAAMGTAQPLCGWWSDAVVAACQEEAQACYCIVSASAALPSGEASYGVWRPMSADGPPGTVVNIRCGLQEAPICTLSP